MRYSDPIDPEFVEFLCNRLDEQGIEYHLETKIVFHSKNKEFVSLSFDDYKFVSDNLNFFQLIFTEYFYNI